MDRQLGMECVVSHSWHSQPLTSNAFRELMNGSGESAKPSLKAKDKSTKLFSLWVLSFSVYTCDIFLSPQEKAAYIH